MKPAHSCWENGGIRHAGSENDPRDELLPLMIVVIEGYRDGSEQDRVLAMSSDGPWLMLAYQQYASGR